MSYVTRMTKSDLSDKEDLGDVRDLGEKSG